MTLNPLFLGLYHKNVVITVWQHKKKCAYKLTESKLIESALRLWILVQSKICWFIDDPIQNIDRFGRFILNIIYSLKYRNFDSFKILMCFVFLFEPIEQNCTCYLCIAILSTNSNLIWCNCLTESFSSYYSSSVYWSWECRCQQNDDNYYSPKPFLYAWVWEYVCKQFCFFSAEVWLSWSRCV